MNAMTKKFILEHKTLIEQSDWKQLFLCAYNDSLITPVVAEIAGVLESAGVANTHDVRSNLLYYFINSALVSAKLDYERNGAKYSNTYAVQFLRRHLNNLFGFTEDQAIELMLYNQKNYKITMTPYGADRINPNNYKIKFED